MPIDGRPWCFGYSERVCPRDEKGFIEPQQHCLQCEFVKACLQEVLKKAGVLPTSVLETPVVSRFTRFLKRWSDQKLACGECDSSRESK